MNSGKANTTFYSEIWRVTMQHEPHVTLRCATLRYVTSKLYQYVLQLAHRDRCTVVSMSGERYGAPPAKKQTCCSQ
jgi:hypothetical protein